MNLFNDNNSINQHCQSLIDSLRFEVSEMTDSEILLCDLSIYSEHLFNRYHIAPIVLYDEGISQRMDTLHSARANGYRGGCAPADKVRIIYTIPYTGNPELLYMRSDLQLESLLPVTDLKIPDKEHMGSFDVTIEIQREILDSYATDSDKRDFVRSEFENQFCGYRMMIDRINGVVRTHNDSLRAIVTELLTKRKEEADSDADLSKALEIPLKLSNDAPNMTPIHLDQTICKPVPKPDIEPSEPEYYISDFDYNNINKIIYLFSTAMERTARSYYHNQEEELRDHLLAALNVYYERATGEAFSKLGKTDINVGFDNRSAFIGECKLWKGERVFGETIQQVMNYSTWRDLKVSVIIFNTKNKSPDRVMSVIDTWIGANTKSHINKHKNMWECTYHRSDMNIDVKLTIMMFDLRLDETQFRDKRKKKK